MTSRESTGTGGERELWHESTEGGGGGGGGSQQEAREGSKGGGVVRVKLHFQRVDKTKSVENDLTDKRGEYRVGQLDICISHT